MRILILATLLCGSLLASEPKTIFGKITATLILKTFADEPKIEIHCVWAARDIADFNGDGKRVEVIRYLRHDGRYCSIQLSQVASTFGVVLPETPEVTVSVKKMHCNGGECSEVWKTVKMPLWPK